MRSGSTLALLLHVGALGTSAAISTQGPPRPAASGIQTSSGFAVASATKTVEARSAEAATRANRDADMDQEIDTVIQMADTNKDGKLSWDEVVAHAKLERQREVIMATQKGEAADLIQELQWDQKSENDLKAAFDISDKNKDGSLCRDELPSMIEEEDEENEREEDESDEEERREEEEAAQQQEEEDEDGAKVSLFQLAEADAPAEADDEDEKLDAVPGEQDSPNRGALTEEIETFEQQADANKDGKLSLKEIKAFFASHMGEDLAQKLQVSNVDLKTEFEAADSNKDGFLDHHELMDLDLDTGSDDPADQAADSEASLAEVAKSEPDNEEEHEGHHKGNSKSRDGSESGFATSSELKDAFEQIDSDKDGRISWLDFKRGIRLARTEKKVPADMDMDTVKSDFNQADGDKDGYIRFKDFVDLAKAEFRRWGDAAGDMLGSLLSLRAA